MLFEHPVFEKTSTFPVPVQDLFGWHENQGAFERLAPPWENIRVIERTGSIRDGDRLVMKIRKGPISLRWVAEHRNYKENEQFCDVQLKGPFSRWEHTHSFRSLGQEKSELTDYIEFQAPLGILGTLSNPFHFSMLKRMFEFRHRRTLHDLIRHAAFKDRPRMKIAITGASGLVGSHLTHFLTTGGHEVFAMVRKQTPEKPRNIYWNPKTGEIEKEKLEGMDAVIHLAGENVASGLWNQARKERIRSSRTDGTSLIATTLASLQRPPYVLISASAVGYYGTSESETFNEQHGPGDDFLANVVREWEQAADPARNAGIRVVHPRIGIVLSPQGGALRKMLPAFRLGIAGPLGHGKQWMSWIALDDLVGLIHHALFTDSLSGPINAVTPNPVTNREFTHTLGSVLYRPTLIPLPSVAIRTVLGEMGRTILLSGQRVCSSVDHGYNFITPSLEEALRSELALYSYK